MGGLQIDIEIIIGIEIEIEIAKDSSLVKPESFARTVEAMTNQIE